MPVAVSRRALSRFRFVLLAMTLTFLAARDATAQSDNVRAVRWPNVLDRPADWYSSEDAIRIADNVLLYQNSNGGWPKNIDMARVLTDADKEKLAANRDKTETIIDNGATHTQIRYLALMHKATGEERFADSARRGLEFVLGAQYENGGWPMIFPLRKGYYTHITFNDGAMIGVMRLLRDVAAGKAPFEFIDQPTRKRAAAAIAKGLEVILKCQIVVNGKPTAWCAQHDEHDYSPAKARSYELPSISGQESVGIVQYLMAIDNPSPEIRAAIRNAVAWFEAAKITGMRVDRIPAPEMEKQRDVVMVADAKAGPLWGRFYDIATNKPIFVGRDGVPHDKLADIEHERRVGYSYVGPYAVDLLERDYPAWQKKWGDK